MTKIITLTVGSSPQPISPALIQAGWLLCYTALWQYESFPDREIGYAQEVINKALLSRMGLKQAFIEYCERILLANRLFHADPSQWVDMPSLWFHPDYSEGFSGTLSVYQQIKTERAMIPGYQRGIKVMANAYWQYLNCPSSIVLKRCRRQLLSLREYNLLQLWNNLIITYQTTYKA